MERTKVDVQSLGSSIFCAVGLLILMVSGCQATLKNPPVDRGFGVYEMPAANFGNMLAQFKSEHPELRITEVSAGHQTWFGENTTYIVITEPK